MANTTMRSTQEKGITPSLTLSSIILKIHTFDDNFKNIDYFN